MGKVAEFDGVGSRIKQMLGGHGECYRFGSGIELLCSARRLPEADVRKAAAAFNHGGATITTTARGNVIRVQGSMAAVEAVVSAALELQKSQPGPV